MNSHSDIEPEYNGFIEYSCIIYWCIKYNGWLVPLNNYIGLEAETYNVDICSISTIIVKDEGSRYNNFDEDAYWSKSTFERAPGNHLFETIGSVEYLLTDNKDHE